MNSEQLYDVLDRIKERRLTGNLEPLQPDEVYGDHPGNLENIPGETYFDEDNLGKLNAIREAIQELRSEGENKKTRIIEKITIGGVTTVLVVGSAVLAWHILRNRPEADITELPNE